MAPKNDKTLFANLATFAVGTLAAGALVAIPVNASADETHPTHTTEKKCSGAKDHEHSGDKKCAGEAKDAESDKHSDDKHSDDKKCSGKKEGAEEGDKACAGDKACGASTK